MQLRLLFISVLLSASAAAQPVANAGIDQTLVWPMNKAIIYAGRPYTWNVTGTVSYGWQQIQGPNTASMSRRLDSVVTINNQDSVVFLHGLVTGVYRFRLTVTAGNGTAFDTVQVTVNPMPVNASPKGIFINNSVYLPATAGSVLNIQPGDTLYLNGNTLPSNAEIVLGNFNGTAAQPVIIKPFGSLVNIARLDIANDGWGVFADVTASYFIIDGSGIAGQTYGIRSKLIGAHSAHHVEIKWCASIGSPQSAIHLGGYKKYGGDRVKFPAMFRVGYFIHDNYIDSSQEEGIYGGPTSLTNQGWDTIRYQPRGDSMFIYNNIIQNTGRDAIQVGGFNRTKIFNNSTFNSGLNGVGGQGSAINLGTLTTGEVSGNYMRKSWRNGSFINGYGNILYANNYLDSCGFFETSGNAIIYVNSSMHNPERTPARTVIVKKNYVRNPYSTLFTGLSANNGLDNPTKFDSNFIWRPNGGSDWYYFDDAASSATGNQSVGSITWPAWPLQRVDGPTLLNPGTNTGNNNGGGSVPANTFPGPRMTNKSKQRFRSQ